MVTDRAEFVSRRIESELRRRKSELLAGDPADLCSTVDNHYSVTVRSSLFTVILERSLSLLLRLSLTFTVSGQRTGNSVDHNGAIALFSSE